MEEIKELLWKRQYEECIASCKNALTANPEDAGMWYFLFLAENRNFLVKENALCDELSFQKALDVADDKQKEELEEAYSILSTLQDIWYLGNLYLAIKEKREDAIILDLESSLKDESVTNKSLSAEFISAITYLASMDGDKGKLYMMLMYLVVKHTENERLKKIFEKLSSESAVNDGIIRHYITLYREKKILEAKPDSEEASKILAEKFRLEAEALKEELDAKKTEYETFRIEKEQAIRKATDKMQYHLGAAGLSESLDELKPERTSKNSFVTFGRYGGENLKWRVLGLKSDRALLLCEKIIDVKRFDSNLNNYERSEIRSWLNHDFYDSFTTEEKKRIIQTSVDNSLSTTGCSQNDFTCRSTIDYFFLLSAKDLKRYFKSNSDRICVGTEMAKRKGLWVYDKNQGSCWWCRSPHFSNSKNVFATSSDGHVYYTEADVAMGVRPACIIKL